VRTWRTSPFEEVEAVCRAVRGEHQLPLPTADRCRTAAGPDKFGMGRATSLRATYLRATHLTHGNRQVVVSAGAGTKACRDGYTVLYKPAAKLFRDLAQARADGSLGRVLEMIARIDAFVVDDFAMASLCDDEWRNFL